MITFEIPIKTVSEANSRSCWQARMRRTKKARAAARVICASEINRSYPFPGRFNYEAKRVITLTRIGKRRMDTDNLTGSMKAIRDGIADALEINDGDWRLEWSYAQEIGKRYSVKVEIR